LYSKSIEE
jgi:hypothetical protein